MLDLPPLYGIKHCLAFIREDNTESRNNLAVAFIIVWGCNISAITWMGVGSYLMMNHDMDGFYTYVTIILREIAYRLISILLHIYFTKIAWQYAKMIDELEEVNSIKNEIQIHQSSILSEDYS